MSITDTSTDLLARFLPVHSDARLVSHYLALLAENEVRLKEQLKQAQEKFCHHAQTAENRPSTEQDTASRMAIINPTPKRLATISEVSFRLPPEQVKPRQNVVNNLYKRGLEYLNGDHDTPVDLDTAIYMFKQSMEWGHLESEVMLGECYYYADDKPDHLHEALKWYDGAAQKGHPYALYSVGYMYYYGEGTKTNEKKALDFLNKAAAAGSADARKMLTKLSRR